MKNLTQISLGGVQFSVLNSCGVDLFGPRWEKFSINSIESLPDNRDRIEVEILDFTKSPDRVTTWDTDLLVMDAGTWAIARTEKLGYCYHLGSSPKRSADFNVFHMYFNADISRAVIYVDLSYEKFLSDELFYPFGQVILHHLMAIRGGLVVHASGLVIEGRGTLFLGDPGAGKSTIAKLFESKLGEECVLSDDRIVLRKQGGVWWMYGTPWYSTLPRVMSKRVPVEELCFLEQTPSHQKLPLRHNELIERFLKVSFGVWWLPEMIGTQLESLSDFISDPRIQFSRLGFKPDQTVVSFLSESKGAFNSCSIEASSKEFC